jgi:putative sugar O-methyltransferase
MLVARSSRADSEFFTLEWWALNKHLFPQELQDLTDQYVAGNDFKLTSKYWLHLMLKNYRMLHEDGYDNFGTTISRNYFTWTDFNQAQISNLVANEINSKIAFDVFKKHVGFSHEESYKHNMLIILLYEATKNLPFLRNALNTISDKGFLLGNTPFISHDGFTLTLDKLSSILEVFIFEKILSEAPLVCEIGGGSGRNSDAILQLFPRTKIIYCDIPPASYIALNRFKKVFPEKFTTVVKSPEDFQALLSATDGWDILIVPPSMLEYIPEKYVDLFIAIDCVHEFSNENRAKLAGIIANVANFFYTKNWTDTIIPIDEIPLSSNHLSGYYFSENWQVVHNQKCLFPGNFTEILFKIT